ncbi:MAG: HEPN domain-containing protein [Planctomycetes bacterium]|nr:HEPN domain-containing protein [Planctomycetota bacterium]
MRDLKAAGQLLNTEEPLSDVVGFHAQQAVEKLLKALLVYHGVEFEKVHTIRYLMDLCVKYAGELELLREHAEPLTRYAVQERYPLPGSEVTIEEAVSAVEAAHRIREVVFRHLPPDCREDRT